MATLIRSHLTAEMPSLNLARAPATLSLKRAAFTPRLHSLSRRQSAAARPRTSLRRIASATATADEVKTAEQAPIETAENPVAVTPDVALPVAAATEQAVIAPYHPTDETILLQGFGWDSCDKGGWYDIVKSKIPDIKAANFTAVWLPPPSQSVSKQGYLPGQLYNLETPYGNKAALKALTDELNQNGLAPVADIVINHRCADAQDEHGVWNTFRDDVDHHGNKVDWGKWAITGNDPEFGGKGNPDTGADYGPAPDLDHTNPDLRASLKDWMNWLALDLGFRGWRFDFVKGYAAQYIQEYISDTLGPDFFHVGEFWTDANWHDSGLAYDQDGSRQVLCDYINAAGGTTTLFDFPTKAILQEACRNTQYGRLRDRDGKAPGLLGWWPSRAVTFTDNHDTGSTQQHWPFPAEKMETGYAYLLTHPGIPCVFWDHFFDWGLGESIKALIAIRQRNNIKADSKLEILCADDDCYVARINDSVTVKLGPRYDMGGLLPNEHEGWKFAHSGMDFAVWEKK